MSKLEVEFKFEIGDIVFFRSAQHDKGNRPRPFCIVERLAQQCHADTQRLYVLACNSGFVPEVALSLEEPSYRPVTVAELDDRDRVRWHEKARFEKEMEQARNERKS